MEINQELISYLENLSCLTLSEEETLKLTDDLGKIINSMAKLSELDTSAQQENEFAPDNAAINPGNTFREDIILPSFPREGILKNSFANDGAMFIAPKTVE
ncbi:MAG: Asp-tRNA(Asn)/Glu-tRNA(Gln) amidotransferase subunit GatC [Oscillospiraceae bacterium]|nr:Asp-tRNA(Asn)/Glu-tRNA(Gln) amidotransferase subunit GatC [Oscillospiraceae bacterium]